MKTIQLSFTKMAAITLVLIAFTACKPEPPVEPQKRCDHNAHFEQIVGLNGAYGDYGIFLENGAFVLPVEVMDNGIHKDEIYNGMEITVSFDELDYNEEIAGKCQVPPLLCMEVAFARITCIAIPVQMECGTAKGFCGTGLDLW